jgi:uncharacterized membrane protein
MLVVKKPIKQEAAPAPKAKEGNFLYIVVYFFTWLGGLIMYLVEKDDKNMRFHAMQAILLGIVMFVISLPIITFPISFLLWFYGLYVGYKAYTGETVRIPYLAEFADKYV